MNLSKKAIIALVVAAVTLISAISAFVWKSTQSSSSSQKIQFLLKSILLKRQRFYLT